MAQGDANLLFGIFAVQLRLATPQQLAAAGAVWATDQSRRLADILVEQGVLSGEDRELISSVIERQLKAAGGDAEQVYQDFGGDQAAQRSFGGSLVFEKPQVGRGRYASIAPVPDSHPSHSGDEAEAVLLAAGDSLPPEQPGRYELRSEQGRGGIGRVLTAYDSAIGREIALKELLVGQGSSGSGGASPGRRSAAQTVRFLREARITGQLEHPGIVPVYEVGRREDGTVYYTMKLVRGDTLADQLQRSRSLGERLALLHHFVDLCQAIAYAHSRGVVHRDIKPANVMVGEFGETLLLDWGLAKVKGQADEGAEKLADEVRLLKEAGAAESFIGKPIGTPSYMPPEQADGRIPDIDERSDVWSLGAVLYEILTGRPPFGGSNAFEVIGMVLSDEVAPVLERVKDAPPELAAIAMRCLVRDPAGRYQSVDKLADDVKAFQTGGLVSAYSYNTALMLRRWASRHMVEVATGAVALLLLVAIGVFSYGKVLEQRNAAVNALARLDKRNNELLGLQLATQSREQLAAGHTERASLLALEAAHFYGKSDSWMPEIDRSLRDCAGAEYFAHVRQYFKANQDGIAFLRDGKHMAAVSGPGMVLWDLSQPQEIPRVFTQASERIAASPDGNWLVTGRSREEFKGVDPKDIPGVLLWDATALEEEPRVLPGSVSDVRSVAFSPDSRYVAAGSEEALARVWDVQHLESPPTLLKGHTQKVMFIAFSPDGKWLATTSADATVRLWDRSDLSKPPRLLAGKERNGHLDQVYCAVFTGDSRMLITCGQDDSVRFWDVTMAEIKAKVLNVHEDTDDIISSVALNPAQTTLVVGCYDEKAIRLFSLSEIERAFETHDLETQSGMADQLADADAGVYVQSKVLRGHEDGIDTLVYNLDGSLLASGAHDHTVRIWELTAPNPEPIELTGQSQAMAVGLSPDGKLVAGAGTGPELALWDLEKSTTIPRKLLHSSDLVRVVTFSKDGRWLAAGGFDNRFRLWDRTELDSPPRVFGMFHYHIRGLAFSPDGHWLASGGEDSADPVYLFDMTDLDKAPLAVPCEERPRSIAFSPDGENMAVSGGEISVYSMSDLGTAPTKLTEHTAAVTSLCYSQDGKRLASASWDGTARLWDMEAPSHTSEVFKAHDGWLYAVALSPDGRYLACGGKSNLVRIWDVTRPDERPEVLLGFEGTVTGLVFTPDGRHLLSSSLDSRLRIWRVGHDQLMQACRARTWRNLTLEEWQTYIGRDRPYEPTLADFPAGPDAPGSPYGR